MKSLSQLTDFYYKDLFPTLQELENRRQRVKFRVILSGMVLLIVDLMVFSFFRDNLDWLLFLNIAVGSFLYKFITHDYTQEFKERVIEPLIHFIDRDLRYVEDMHISESKFINSRLFTSTPDKIEGNDYIAGMIDGVKIELSDMHAQKRDKDSKGRSSWRTIFRGLFIITEFNKNFSGKTVVLPDSAQNSFGDLIGNWLQSHNINRDELIKMDDPEFEREFVVYGSDQIEARYILSHSLMKRLLGFKRKSGHKVYVSFVYNNVYIAIEYGKDLFEPSVFNTLLDYKVAMDYLQTLHLAVSIRQELNIDQKIWSRV